MTAVRRRLRLLSTMTFSAASAAAALVCACLLLPPLLTAAAGNDRQAGISARLHPLGRAMWVWVTEPLLTDAAARADFLGFCRAHGVAEVFLQAAYETRRTAAGEPVCTLSHPDELRALLKAASRIRLRVHALDGYPEFVLEREHRGVLALVRALLDFNSSGAPDERFYGIHFDDEPYQLLGFDSSAREGILRQFLELNEKVMALLKVVPERPVYGVDVPFWFDGTGSGCSVTYGGLKKPVTEHLLELLDNIGVMDYRNVAGGEDGIVEHARPAIACASRAGKRVWIGIETGRANPARIRFLYGVTEAAWQALAEANAPFLLSSRLDGFRLRLLGDGARRFPGLEEPALPESRSALEASLTRLYQVYGATADGREGDLNEISREAQAALLRYPAYSGFKKFALHAPDGRTLAAGFWTTELSPEKTTFAGSNKREMERVLREAAEAFGSAPGFAGFAIHDYSAYRNLPQ